MPRIRLTRLLGRFSSLLLCASLAGCDDDSVVVYTALDEDFSRTVFSDFTAHTGVEIRAKFDTESNKSVGLTQALLAEQARPRCDLFWNNEILNTLRLEQAGLLRPYVSPAAQPYPAAVRSPDGMWYGFAARARVLIVNTELVAQADRPSSILDLADPRWQGRAALAKPLFGTTATHGAVLFAHWGTDRGAAFFRAVHDNAQTLPGNKQVALAVSSGRVSWGLTDTDDALIELQKGHPITIVYPDAGPDQMGTLFIPNTLALIKGSPQPQRAERLVDYLLSAEVERRLAMGPSAQIPLQSGIEMPLRTETPRTVRAMEVDWAAARDAWDESRRILIDIFARSE